MIRILEWALSVENASFWEKGNSDHPLHIFKTHVILRRIFDLVTRRESVKLFWTRLHFVALSEQIWLFVSELLFSFCSITEIVLRYMSSMRAHLYCVRLTRRFMLIVLNYAFHFSYLLNIFGRNKVKYFDRPSAVFFCH